MAKKRRSGSRAAQRSAGGRPRPRPGGGQQSTAVRNETRADARARAARRRPPPRRSRRPSNGILAIGAVVLAVVAIVVLRLFSSSSNGAGVTGLAPAAVVQKATSVPVSALDAAGPGTGLSIPKKVAAGTLPLVQGNLPRVVYVGADYCPFCAYQRWPIVVALSRFGTFSKLGQAESAPAPEVYPKTKTFSFHGSSYTSKYLVFSAVEQETTDRKSLDPTPTDVQELLNRFDGPPYTQSGGAIPFLDIANRYIVVGATGDPGALQGKSMLQIATDLSNPSTDIAGQINGAANLLTAAICEATGNQPVNVCQSTAITQAQARLAAGG